MRTGYSDRLTMPHRTSIPTISLPLSTRPFTPPLRHPTISTPPLPPLSFLITKIPQQTQPRQPSNQPPHLPPPPPLQPINLRRIPLLLFPTTPLHTRRKSQRQILRMHSPSLTHSLLIIRQRGLNIARTPPLLHNEVADAHEAEGADEQGQHLSGEMQLIVMGPAEHGGYVVEV